MSLSGSVIKFFNLFGKFLHNMSGTEIKNRMNGITINASRNFAENLLALLQGQTPTKTYGKSGTVYRDSNVTALGSA